MVETSSKKTDRLPGTSDRLALTFAIVFPSLVTWVYFVYLADGGSSGQQLAFGVGKAIQFCFPLFWVCVVQKQCERIRWSLSGVGIGFWLGVAITASMALLYFTVLKPLGYFDEASGAIIEKVRGFGIRGVVPYVALGVFYALIHSGMEEYYWRWFVFRQLKSMMKPSRAAVVSSLGFMAHHVILMVYYFGWDSPLTYFFSLSVAVGGLLWAWLYHRSQSILGPWLSHMLVDAGIFVIGYDLVKQVLA